MRLLKIYLVLLRAYWERAVAYRVVFLISLLHMVLPLVVMSIWMQMARDEPVRGYTPALFVGYYLAAILARRLTNVGIVADLETLIRFGGLATFLLKPLALAHHLIARLISGRPITLLPTLGLVALLAVLTPGEQFALSAERVVLFVTACVLGLAFEFLLQYALGGMAFWLTQARSLSLALNFVRLFLGGYLVPIDLFPPLMQAALRWLPFQISVALPAEILVGTASAERMAQGLLAGAIWTIVMAGVARGVWAAGLRSYSAIGV